MKFQNVKEKTGEFFKKAYSKVGKRAVIVAVCVLLIGLAVFLNVVLWKTPATLDESPTPASASLSGAEKVEDKTADTPTASGYFAEVILSREKARDEAIEVLSGVIDSDTAVDEMKADARAQIERMAKDIEDEANIETLVRSKGMGDCVAVISGDKANVVVKIDGMTDAQVSQISEIVYEQSGIIPANLKIINN